MSQLSSIKLGIAKKLRDRGYRHRFFARMAQDEVATQIRTLREKRGLRQADLAKQAQMKQPFVSRMEQSEHAGWNFQTLLRLACALDAKLHITFEPIEDVLRRYERDEGAALASTPPEHVNQKSVIPAGGSYVEGAAPILPDETARIASALSGHDIADMWTTQGLLGNTVAVFPTEQRAG
jgi:transcriptional regulator with XRE-family HTH domain